MAERDRKKRGGPQRYFFWSNTFTQRTKKAPEASHIFIIELVQGAEEEGAGPKLHFCCRCSFWPYDCKFMMRREERTRCPWVSKWKLLSGVRLFATPWTIVHEILWARILEWVVYPFSSGSSWPRNWTRVSCIAGGFFTNWAIREAMMPLLGSI